MDRAASESAMAKISVATAWVAVAASAAALALLLSLHMLSPEFSPAWRMISESATGQYGWVLSLMFVVYGLGSLALAVAIRAQVNTRRGRLGLALLTLSGIGQASAAQFDLNQAALHELAGALGILCLPLAAMLISPTFLQALGALPTTPPENLPAGVIALVGWTNRLVVISAWTWVATVAGQAIKLHNTGRTASSGTLLWNANDMKGAPQS